MLPCFERVHSHRRHTLNSGQVTTTRKIFSTLYSIFRNPANGLNGMQWSGTTMVFAGLLGDIARKLAKKAPAPPPPPPSPESDPTKSE